MTNQEYFNVIFEDDTNFIDYSLDAKDFGKDSFDIDYVILEDKFYVGLYKPFERLYVDLSSPSSINVGISVKQFFDGSFNEVESRDETKGLTRSGFLRFEESDDWQVSSINGIDAYWIRLDIDADSNFSVQGIAEIFSEDSDLIEEYDDIHEFLPDGKMSFILKHQAAKKDIIQSIRNAGSKKSRENKLRHIGQFDFLFPDEELRQASKYLTLHKIFFNIHDTEEGIYSKLASDYLNKYNKAYETLYLGLDKNDDGKASLSETARIRSVNLRRI